MANEPICIRRTATSEEADVIVAWLDDQGVKATVLGGDSLDVHALGLTDPEGVGIFVADAETAKRAEALLEEHDRTATRRGGRGKLGSVMVKCDGCGHTNTFTADLCGTTQECARCGAYLDVPEPEMLA